MSTITDIIFLLCAIIKILCCSGISFLMFPEGEYQIPKRIHHG